MECTRIEPGDVEQVVAILLCREKPRGCAARPSRGDGGIDILVPLDGGGTVAVYQVKSFTSNLTSSCYGSAGATSSRRWCAGS